MNTQKNFRSAVIIAAAVSLCVSARAGQSEVLVSGDMSFARTLASIMIPMQPKDAFAGLSECGILNAKSFRAYTLLEAVDTLKPCLQAVSARYAMTITPKAGLVDSAPAIQLLVKGQLPTGNSALMDLYRALNLRDQQLLGFRVGVVREGEPQAEFKSSVQAAVDRCILPMMVRKIENSADFVRFYGACITRDPSLKVKSIRPSAGHQLGVTILSDAEKAEVETLNGSVVVNSGTGPVTIVVVAYPNEIVLP